MSPLDSPLERNSSRLPLECTAFHQIPHWKSGPVFPSLAPHCPSSSPHTAFLQFPWPLDLDPPHCTCSFFSQKPLLVLLISSLFSISLISGLSYFFPSIFFGFIFCSPTRFWDKILAQKVLSLFFSFLLYTFPSIFPTPLLYTLKVFS